MLLLGVCDHRYRLTYVTFGDYGSESFFNSPGAVEWQEEYA